MQKGVTTILTKKEKDDLYEDFKDRLRKEKRSNDILAEVREAHYARYEAAEGVVMRPHGCNQSYFNGWSQITALVSKAFACKNPTRIEDKEMAIEMAKRLSDIYFEYLYKKEAMVSSRTEKPCVSGDVMAW